MRWYADNSEMTGTRGAKIPDILLFGGIVVSAEIEEPLRRAIEEYKRVHFGNSRVPLKWNFKDLKDVYEKKGAIELYTTMLGNANTWREELLQLALGFDFRIVIACLESHSMERLIIKARKSDLARYVFANGLMRVALHAASTEPDTVAVMLDWPDKADPKPYDEEYSSAYRRGRTADGKITYHAGPLKDLNFSDSVFYVNMNHSAILQVSDVVLGATRELVDVALEGRQAGLGTQLCVSMKERYVGYPGNICRYGINIASNNAATRARVRAHISATLV
jgi:hypothetical protein